MIAPGSHLPSLLVAAVLAALAVRFAIAWKQGKTASLPERGLAWRAMAAGALAANGLVHFVHGASGERFPAPFAFWFAAAHANSALNVLWGGFCLWIAVRLGADPRVSRGLVLLGLVAMGLLLSAIF